jgi:hypothetical protein
MAASRSPAALYLMLQNRVYRGEIVHKGVAYRGEHGPIIEEHLWTSVQLQLEANGVERREGQAPARSNLLTLLRRLAGCEVAKRLICHGRASKVFTTWGKGGWLRGR